jgi:hypothetical protein
MTPFHVSNITMSLVKEELAKTAMSTLVKAWMSGIIVNLSAPTLVIEPRVRKLNKHSFMSSSGSGLIQRTISFLKNNDRQFIFWITIGLVGSAVSLSFQILGWIILLRQMLWPAIFSAFVIAYFLILNGPIGGPKYRLPIEPILIIFQSVSVIRLFSWLRIKYHKKFGRV